MESTCPLQVYEAIPGERVCTDIIDDVRMIKSNYEIGRIVYACDIITTAHNRLLAGARPGRTLPQVASELSGMMMARILQAWDFCTGCLLHNEWHRGPWSTQDDGSRRVSF